MFCPYVKPVCSHKQSHCVPPKDNVTSHREKSGSFILCIIVCLCILCILLVKLVSAFIAMYTVFIFRCILQNEKCAFQEKPHATQTASAHREKHALTSKSTPQTINKTSQAREKISVY